MKIDRKHFDEYELNGKKLYAFRKVNEAIGAYDAPGETVLFELNTDERIGYISESDVRASRNHYYNVGCLYGWDGSKKTKKDYVKKLCTKAEYGVAESLLLEEYKERKNK